MKRIHIVCLALVAVFATSAMVSSSAFAVSKFLLNAAAITTKISTETTGELLLEDSEASPKVDVTCSGIFDGTIEPEGVLGFIEKVLNLSKVEEVPLKCSASLCTTVTVTPIHLPWHVEVELVAGEYRLHLLNEEAGKVPGYTVDCNSIVGLVEDTCEGLAVVDLTSAATDVEGMFLEDATINPPGACTLSKKSSGLVVSIGPGLITSPEGTLSLSE